MNPSWIRVHVLHTIPGQSTIRFQPQQTLYQISLHYTITGTTQFPTDCLSECGVWGAHLSLPLLPSWGRTWARWTLWTDWAGIWPVRNWQCTSPVVSTLVWCRQPEVELTLPIEAPCVVLDYPENFDTSAVIENGAIGSIWNHGGRYLETIRAATIFNSQLVLWLKLTVELQLKILWFLQSSKQVTTVTQVMK